MENFSIRFLEHAFFTEVNMLTVHCDHFKAIQIMNVMMKDEQNIPSI